MRNIRTVIMYSSFETFVVLDLVFSALGPDDNYWYFWTICLWKQLICSLFCLHTSRAVTDHKESLYTIVLANMIPLPLCILWMIKNFSIYYVLDLTIFIVIVPLCFEYGTKQRKSVSDEVVTRYGAVDWDPPVVVTEKLILP